MSQILKLVQHLKENPTAAQVGADKLARQFDLEPAQAAMAVKAMQGASKTASAAKAKPPGLLAPFLASRLAAMQRPLAYILAVFGFFGMARMAQRLLWQGDLHPAVTVATVAIPLVLALEVMYRRGELKLIWMPAAGLAFFTILANIGAPGSSIIDSLGAGAALAALSLILTAPTATVGGLAKLRRDEKAIEGMTRQQMLDRLLEIRDAMERGSLAAPGSRLTWDDRLQNRKWLWISLLSAFGSLSTHLVYFWMDPAGKTLANPASTPILLGLIALAASLFSMFVVGLVGYLARTWPECLLAAVLDRSISMAILFLGIPPITWETTVRMGLAQTIIGWTLVLLVYAAGTAAYKVTHRRETLRRREANDPTELMAEMLELEWKLRPQSLAIVVMSVDVAGSTKMKAGADPYVAEWSFRAYQDLVASAAAPHGGEVKSRAGDGTILAFPTVNSALAAAASIYAQLTEFNVSQNRLASPFRIRIGIHAGEAAGELGEVQYSEVIDIAAHTESAAPIGGIALTQAALQLADEFAVVPLEAAPDGIPLYAIA